MQQQIEKELNVFFKPDYIKIYDKSASHRNHPEAKQNGGGHYSLILVSDHFDGLSLIQRQREVHKVLEQHLKAGGSIHALSMKLYTTEQWQKKHEQE